MSSAASATPGPCGLLGGSFDPVHLGHLQLARDAQRALGLAQVVFLPAGQPWQKSGLSPAPERLRLLELALAGTPDWRIDRRELDRAGPTYTVETLEALRREAGPRASLVWILGADQLQGLPSWHRWRELPGLAHLAWARRGGEDPILPDAVAALLRECAGSAADLAALPCGRIAAFEMTPVPCSATALRQALARGDETAAAPWLPPAVLDYLRTHPLYSGHPAPKNGH